MTNKLSVLPSQATSPLAATIEDYLVNVDARTRNPRTREFYENALVRVLLPFCDKRGLNRVQDLDQGVLDRLAADLNHRVSERTGKALSAASVGSYLRAVRQFLSWAAKGKLVEAGLTVPRPRNQRADLEVLSPREVADLIAATATTRDRVLLELLWQTGLRLSEALALTDEDLIDRGRDGRFVRIRHRERGGGAKGDSFRLVPIRPSLFTALHQLASRGRPADAMTERIFITSRRRPNGEYTALASRTVEQMLRVAAAKAGIQKRVYPHLLRHSMATHWMNTKGDPVTLQRILGHADLSMISRTYAHPTSGDLYQSMMDYLRGEE
jgi:integrase/recombinase XerC